MGEQYLSVKASQTTVKALCTRLTGIMARQFDARGAQLVQRRGISSLVVKVHVAPTEIVTEEENDVWGL